MDQSAITSIPDFSYPRRLDLGEFRLLRFADEQQAGIIRLTVHVAELEHAPDFVALSYTWGDPTNPAPILCDGKVLNVTRNLHAALSQMKNRWCGPTPDSRKAHYIWIDAICINQNDLTEREQQVRQMRPIYSASTRVIVWLGPEGPKDAQAFAQLTRLNAWGRSRNILPYLTKHVSLLESTSNDDEQIAASDQEFATWDTIETVFQRPWFSRCWIIQEYVCASDVEFWAGPRVVDKRSFIIAPLAATAQAAMRGLSRASHQPARDNPFYHAAELSRLKAMFQEGGVRSLYDALSVTYGFNATMPLDRIFAVAGLVAKDSLDLTKLINYSLTLEQLLLSIAKTMVMSNTPGVALLSHVIDSRQRLGSLPSWVPEWRTKGCVYSPLGLAFRHEPNGKQYCHVDEDNVCQVTDACNHVFVRGMLILLQALHAQGRIFDRIERLIPPPHATFDQTYNRPGSIYTWVIKVQKLAYALQKNTDKSKINKQLQDTLVCGHLIETPSNSPYTAIPEDNSDLLQSWLDALHTCAYPLGRPTHLILDLPVVRNTIQPRIKASLQAITSTIRTICISSFQFTRRQYALHPILFKPLRWILTIIFATTILISAFILLSLQRAVTSLLPNHALSATKWLRDKLTPILEACGNAALHLVTRPFRVFKTLMHASLSSYNTAFDTWSTGRVFCVTRQGRYGWVPESAEVGDVVVVLRGCRIPFVVREGDEGWEVVGDGYIAGVMDGMFDKEEEDEGEDIVIV